MDDFSEVMKELRAAVPVVVKAWLSGKRAARRHEVILLVLRSELDNGFEVAGQRALHVADAVYPETRDAAE